jgi:hypothetical protein
MNDESEGIWIEAVYCHRICLEGLRKTTNRSVRTAGMSDET